MKFCANCETKLSQNHKDLGAPWICPKCNPEKMVVRKPTPPPKLFWKDKTMFKGMRFRNLLG